MATLKIEIRKEFQRVDGKFPISICLTHKRKTIRISTGRYAEKSQLTRSFELKDRQLLGVMLERIAAYEKIIDQTGLDIENYTARELADRIIEKSKPNKGLDVDFIEMALLHIDQTIKDGRKGSAANYKTAILALSDFRGAQKTSIKSFTYKTLEDFAKYLKTERVVTRPNQLGRTTTTTKQALSDISVNNYIRDLRTLYNVVIEQLDEELMNEALIKYNPFRKFKMHLINPTSSQRTIQIDELRKILFITLPEDSDYRTILGRDMYILSFLLVGINSIDLWNLPTSAYKDGRLSYNRMKTKDRRSDQALISIKIEDEAKELIQKYIDLESDQLFRFKKMYNNARNFNKAINIGLSKVADILKLESRLTFYTARHSWATIARNRCRISKDDIHLALNHSDSRMSITDRYIERNWDFIDEANRKVIDYVYSKE